MREIIAFGLLVLPTTALAEDWTVEIQPEGCAASNTFYQGSRPTTLVLIEHDRGSGIIIHNEGWSVEPGETYEVGLNVDSDTFSGPATGGDQGTLISRVNEEVLDAIQRGRRLVATLLRSEGGPRVLEEFDLTGSAEAVSRVRACNQLRLEREKRAETVRPDPFQIKPKRPSD